jgi:hypothetical protein
LRHSRSACRPIVHELDDRLSKDRTVYFIRSIAGTTMVLTMFVLVLAFVRKWRAKRELPTAA